jgi:hypothetical protein
LHHVSVRIDTNFFFLYIIFLLEKLDLQLLYNQDDDMNRYHDQDGETETTTTTTTTSTTTTLRPVFEDYNPSIDMGQYCGACRYYSRRLHVKKYCKRDYSKLKN